MITKRGENVRRFKLKTDRCKIKIDEIGTEFLPTDQSAAVFESIRRAALARLDALPGELLAAVQDRRTSPGVAQEALQATVYKCLSDIADPEFVTHARRSVRR